MSWEAVEHLLGAKVMITGPEQGVARRGGVWAFVSSSEEGPELLGGAKLGQEPHGGIAV